MSYPHYHHRSAKVEVGQDCVTITSGSGAVSWARIVHAERQGERIVYAMLDRKIHDDYTGYGDYKMSGCFATEMRSEALPDLFDDEIDPDEFDVSPELAERIASKVRTEAPDCWVGVPARENFIKDIVYQLVESDEITEQIFERLKASAIERGAKAPC